MINLSGLVGEVRRALDEVTLDGDLAVYATQMEDLFSSTFSDEDLRDRILDATRYIAARVRARYLDELISEVDPADSDVLYTYTGNSQNPFLRLLNSRVEVNGVEAERRTVRGNEKIEATGQAATPVSPAYVYEDYLFFTAGNPGGTVTADVVEVPVFTTSGSFDGETWTTDGSTTVPLRGMFKEAIVQYVVSSCFITMGLGEEATMARQKMNDEIGPYLLPMALVGAEDEEDE